jgi:hypothetical protein
MLSGLFKRKDKKGKATEDDGEEFERTSEEAPQISPQPKTSLESLQESRTIKPQAVQRQTSKLQKQHPSELASKREPQQRPTSQEPAVHGKDIPSPSKDGFGPSIRRVVSPQFGDIARPNSASTPGASQEIVASPGLLKADSDSAPVNLTVDVLPKTNDDHSIRAESQAATLSTSQPPHVASPLEQFQQQTMSDNRGVQAGSPVAASIARDSTPTNPAVLVGDTSSQEERSISLSPQSSSPELIDTNDQKGYEGTPVSTVYSSTTPSWSDASLRTYLEDDNDIRDLLIIVHDKSNVQPAGPDHPITGSLFKEESRRLKEMSSRLDEYLANWITRKLGNRTPK